MLYFVFVLFVYALLVLEEIKVSILNDTSNATDRVFAIISNLDKIMK